MIQKHIDEISKDDILSLIDNSVAERKTLEYKQQLPGQSDKDKKEFLADITSFANASGGDIIFGVTAATDDSGAKTGGPGTIEPISESHDAAKLRLEEIIRNGIAPRIRVQIREIVGWGDDGLSCVMLVRIPKSFASPHMVTFRGSSRFYARNSAGKYLLDVQEIRSAFLATDSQAGRIKQFKQNRLGKIMADETPVALCSSRRLVLHLIPIVSFLSEDRVDLSDRHSLMTSFPPMSTSGWDSRHNLDGILIWNPGSEKRVGSDGYCQLFFDGTVESTFCDIPYSDNDNNIASVAYERDLIQATGQYLQGYNKLGIIPPVIVSLAMLGYQGSYMSVSGRLGIRNRHVVDRDAVILPDVVIENLDSDVSLELKPIFDAVWNACGYPCSQNYDSNGKWNSK